MKNIKDIENIDMKNEKKFNIQDTVQQLHIGKNYYPTISEAAIAISMMFGTDIAKDVLDMYTTMSCADIKLQRIRCTKFSIAIKNDICVELYDDANNYDAMLIKKRRDNYIDPENKWEVEKYFNN